MNFSFNTDINNIYQSQSVTEDPITPLTREDRLKQLNYRLAEIKVLLCEEQRLVVPEDVISAIRSELRFAPRQEKKQMRRWIRAADSVDDRLSLLIVQKHLCEQDIKSLASVAESSSWQSQSTTKDDTPQSPKQQAETGVDSVTSCDAVKYFRDRYPSIPIDFLIVEVELSIKGLKQEICRQVLPAIFDLPLGYATYVSDKADSVHMSLLRLNSLLEELKSIDGVKAAGNQDPESKPESVKSVKDLRKSTPQESELRRQKTMIVDIARWEQLDWKLPIKGYTKADYQSEVDRRYKLAQNVSKRHAQVTRWCSEINRHLNKVNDDGTNCTDLNAGYTGLNTGSHTYNAFGPKR